MNIFIFRFIVKICNIVILSIVYENMVYNIYNSI